MLLTYYTPFFCPYKKIVHVGRVFPPVIGSAIFCEPRRRVHVAPHVFRETNSWFL